MSKYNLTDILEQYRIGSGWTTDFDYEGMLRSGLKTGVDTDIVVLKKMSDDFEDVNYHRENNHLQKAIDALEEGAIKEASMFFGDFHAEIKATMETFDMGIEPTLGKFMDSKMEEKEEKKLPMDEIAGYDRKGNKQQDTDGSDAAKYKKAAMDVKEAREYAPMDRDVANRIESFLNIPMKKKFLDAWEDLFYNLVDDEPFYVDDVIAHLANEMSKSIHGNQMAGDRLAGIGVIDDFEQEEFTAIDEEDSISGEDDYAEELSDKMRMKEADAVNFNMKADADYDEGLEDIEEALPKFMGVPEKPSIIRALKVDGNGTKMEIDLYMASLKQSGDEFDDVDDYVEDFKNYVADKALQEHFGRFMKDYQ